MYLEAIKLVYPFIRLSIADPRGRHHIYYVDKLVELEDAPHGLLEQTDLQSSHCHEASICRIDEQFKTVIVF